MTKTQVLVRMLALGAIVLGRPPRASAQMADSYRQAAAAYRDAASKAPADRRACFLRWASYYDGIAASLATNGPPTPQQPAGDPGCPSGGGSSGVTGNGSAFGGAAPMGVTGPGSQNGVVAALNVLSGWAAQRAEESKQRWANAEAEQKRRESEAENAPEAVRDMVMSASLGNERSVLAALLDGVPVNGTDEYGHSALFQAAGNNDVWMMRLLLQRGASPAIEDTWGSTAFIEAAGGGNMQAALMLLAAGADPRHAPFMPSQDPALKQAQFFGHHDLERLIRYAMKPDGEFRSLLNRMLRPSAKDDELNRAAARGNVSTIRALIAAGANPNGADEFSFTPLQNAVVRDEAEAVRALLSLGADPNAANTFGQTALMLAARGLRGCADCDPSKLEDNKAWKIAGLLIDAGARGALRDFANFTATDYFKNSGWGAKDKNKKDGAVRIMAMLSRAGG